MLKRAVLFSALLLITMCTASLSCQAATVTVLVRPATCPAGSSNCCIQSGTKGEDAGGNPIVDSGDSLVWSFPTAATQASIQFGTTNCPYGSTPAACSLSSNSNTITAASTVGNASPGHTWPYTSMAWSTSTANGSCSNVVSPTNPGSVQPPGIVMRPPSQTPKASKKNSKKQ